MVCDRHVCGAARVALPSGGLPMRHLVAMAPRVAQKCVPLPPWKAIGILGQILTDVKRPVYNRPSTEHRTGHSPI